MKKIITLFPFLYFTFSHGIETTAQNTISKKTNKEIELKEKAYKAYTNLKTKHPDSVTPKSPVKSATFRLDENDPYQGRKAEFLSQIITNELPIDFPQYKKGYGVKGYNQMITEYYKNNQTLLKEPLRLKLLSH